jgi:hypothetical protein
MDEDPEPEEADLASPSSPPLRMPVEATPPAPRAPSAPSPFASTAPSPFVPLAASPKPADDDDNPWAIDCLRENPDNNPRHRSFECFMAERYKKDRGRVARAQAGEHDRKSGAHRGARTPNWLPDEPATPVSNSDGHDAMDNPQANLDLRDLIRDYVHRRFKCEPRKWTDRADNAIEITKDGLVDMITIGRDRHVDHAFRYVGLVDIFGYEDVICRATGNREID